MKCNVGKQLVCERGIYGYQRELGFKIDKIGPNDKVLDIGSGYGTFQEQCNQKGLDVIALDPMYYSPNRTTSIPSDEWDKLGLDEKVFRKHMETKNIFRNNYDRKIAGIAEMLPFKDKTFNYILSDCSSFFYLNSNYKDVNERFEVARSMFSEALRVLKPHGEIRIAQLVFCENRNDEEYYGTVLKSLNLPKRVRWGTRRTHYGPFYFIVKK